MGITCAKLFTIEHPNESRIGNCPNWKPYYYIDDNENYCHIDENDIRYGNCNKCWNQPVTNPEKLAEIEKDAEKSWGDRITDNLNLEKSKVEEIADKFSRDYIVSAKELHEIMSKEQRDAFNQCIEDAHDKEVNPVLVEPKIKDSGERREFETGAVRDIQEGKGRCDLLPLDITSRLLGNPELNDEIIHNIDEFKRTGNTVYLYRVLTDMTKHWDDGKTKVSTNQIITQRRCSMLLEVAKHFEEGAKKYEENNWQKGIPVHCYIDSAVRHYLKFLRGDDDEPHDRAFVWNIMCCIWTCVYKPELNDFCEVKKDDGNE